MKWNERQKNLAWRLRSKQALDDLAQCILKQKTDIESFRRLAYTFGLCYTEDERRLNAARMATFSKHAAFQGEDFQLIIREFLEKDINDPQPVALTQSYVFPKSFGAQTKLAPIDDIIALKPNVSNGRTKSALCLVCHKMNGAGVAFGPDLSSWGLVRDTAPVVRAMLTPSSELAHGYD